MRGVGERHGPDMVAAASLNAWGPQPELVGLVREPGLGHEGAGAQLLGPRERSSMETPPHLGTGHVDRMVPDVDC